MVVGQTGQLDHTATTLRRRRGHGDPARRAEIGVRAVPLGAEEAERRGHGVTVGVHDGQSTREPESLGGGGLQAVHGGDRLQRRHGNGEGVDELAPPRAADEIGKRRARRRRRIAHPRPGEAMHDERVAAEQGDRARADRVRLVALQPAPLGGDVRGVGCRPDDLAPAIAEPGDQLIVLDDRPAVAVQDRRP